VENRKISNTQDILAVCNYVWCLGTVIDSFSLFDWPKGWCLHSSNKQNIALYWGIWNQSNVLYSHLL